MDKFVPMLIKNLEGGQNLKKARFCVLPKKLSLKQKGRYPMSSFQDILLSKGIITPEQLEAARELAKTTACSLGQSLLKTTACSQNEISRALALSYGLEFVSLEHQTIEPEILSLIPSDMALQYRAVPISLKDDLLTVAMDDFSLETIDTLAFYAGKRIRIAIATPGDIDAVLEQLYRDREMKKSATDAQKPGNVGIRTDDDTGIDSDANDAPIIRYVTGLIERAIQERASDIHVEPFEDIVRIRFRIDGVCRTVETFKKRLQGPVISRLKIMSGMDMAEKRRTQSGRILTKFLGREIDLRVSSLPGRHGESMVMRILDKEKGLVDLEELGFHETDLERFESIIRRPNGIFLVTGPTGSGKTTTLYAALKKLNRPDVNIETAENPVEYSIEGINQTQVRHDIGLNFSRILRSMMRQAPNIILVGEIRDRETADIAIQAALTGHLVFSTLHTNDAPSAITRLIDMKVKPFLVSTAVMAIMGQRLVRALCRECRRAYEPTDTELRSIGLTRSQAGDAVLYEAAGCKSCNNKGYRGRKGIFELMEMSEDIKKMAFEKQPLSKIRALAESEGMVTLQRDGVRKVLAGITTIREILRVTHTLE